VWWARSQRFYDHHFHEWCNWTHRQLEQKKQSRHLNQRQTCLEQLKLKNLAHVWWHHQLPHDDSMTLSLKAMNLDLKMTVRVCMHMHQTLMFMPTTKAVEKHIATKFPKPASLEWKCGIQFRRSKNRVSVPWVSGAKCVDTRAEVDVQVAAKQRMLTTKRHMHQEARRFQISMGWSMTKQSYLKGTSAARKWARPALTKEQKCGWMDHYQHWWRPWHAVCGSPDVVQCESWILQMTEKEDQTRQSSKRSVWQALLMHSSWCIRC